MTVLLDRARVTSTCNGRTYLKTQGEIEAAICEGLSHFAQAYLGRGPSNIRAHLLGDLLLVRMQGVLTVGEEHLVSSKLSEKGCGLVKQARTQLIEAARPEFEALVYQVTEVQLLSLHHDISTRTGEEVVLFVLAETPAFRESKKKAL